MKFTHIRNVIENSSSDEFTVVKLAKLKKLLAAYDNIAEHQQHSDTICDLRKECLALSNENSDLRYRLRVLENEFISLRTSSAVETGWPQQAETKV